jgi:hypothetical protein
MMVGFVIGDYVAWGKGNVGTIRYFSDDFSTAYVRRATDRAIVAVKVAALRKLLRVATG